jgi:hypothetical protein
VNPKQAVSPAQVLIWEYGSTAQQALCGVAIKPLCICMRRRCVLCGIALKCSVMCENAQGNTNPNVKREESIVVFVTKGNQFCYRIVLRMLFTSHSAPEICWVCGADLACAAYGGALPPPAPPKIDFRFCNGKCLDIYVIVYYNIKATPPKEHLKILCVICLHIFRHSAQKSFDRRQLEAPRKWLRHNCCKHSSRDCLHDFCTI